MCGQPVADQRSQPDASQLTLPGVAERIDGVDPRDNFPREPKDLSRTIVDRNKETVRAQLTNREPDRLNRGMKGQQTCFGWLGGSERTEIIQVEPFTDGIGRRSEEVDVDRLAADPVRKATSAAVEAILPLR